MSNIMAIVAVLMAMAAAFLLFYGIYEGYLRHFFEEVQTQDERSLLKSMQKVILSRLGVINRRFMTQRYEIRIRQTLVKAGDPADMKPEEVLGLHEIGALLGLIVGFYVWALTSLGFWVVIVTALLAGLYPAIWLRDQVTKRHFLIARALPYNIDLLTLSVEAGLDFTAALAKVVEKGKPGPLNDEFALALRQLKMGKTREQSLRTMIERVDLPSLTSFLTALIQADRMGTSMGKVLRIQSTQMRIERTQRAEKLANEAPVKMLFPLIACIFPTVFMVLFGPIVFQFIYGGIQ